MKHILVVDDNKLNLLIARDSLKHKYKISIVNCGVDALELIKQDPVDLILLDIEMPEMDGIETLKRIKQDDMTASIPIVFLTSINDRDVEATCLTLGAQDFIVKPFYKPAMLQRVERVLELEDLRSNLEKQVLEKTEELERLTLQTITTFANAIDAKDPYTKGHSARVAKYSRCIAERLGWSELGSRNLYYTALLHDIGKIGVPDYILNKTAKLADEEYDIIKKHPEIGGHILEDVIVVPYLGIGAYTHHERYDGKGYPKGQKEEEIPLIGRIIAVTDAVDAMLSMRAYRDKLSMEEVVSELKRCRGTQFDPILADLMIDLIDSGVISRAAELEQDDNNTLLMKVINEYVNFSKVDGLTGLWNRIYLEEKTMESLCRSITGAFFIIDLDNFKSVNDVWGHLAGDTLLVNIALAIQSTLEKSDIACRMGGDEFGIYFPKLANIEETTKVAERLLRKINKKIMDLHSPFKVTASFGIAIAPEDGEDYNTLYHHADKALYYAKNNGKNNFFFYKNIQKKSARFGANNTAVSLNSLKNMLVETDEVKGAYLVNTKEFEKIFHILRRLSQRSNGLIQIILFTFTSATENPLNEFELAEALKFLVLSIKDSLMIGDIATKFNNSQYIVLLKDVKTETGKKIAEKIIKHYFHLNGSDYIKLNYEIDQFR